MIKSSPVLSLTKVKRQEKVKWRDQIPRTSNRVESGTLGNHSSGLSIMTWVMVFPFNWPGVLEAMGLQRVRYDWVTELNWTEWSSLGGSVVKTLPAMQETWVWSLGWEDPLEKKTSTPSSILAWRFPWTLDPGGLWSMGLQKSWTQLSD